jgi:hypothetical protein
LQLQEYFLFRYQQWQTYNPEHLYPIKLNDADTIRSYSRQLLADQRLFTRYLLTKMGFREVIANAASFVYPLVQNLLAGYDQRQFVCTELAYEVESY